VDTKRRAYLGSHDGDRLVRREELDVGGGKMGDIHGLPKARLAILPGTTHIGMLQRVNFWGPMVTEFLDSDLNPKPPNF